MIARAFVGLLALVAGAGAAVAAGPTFSSKYTPVSYEPKGGCKTKVEGKDGQDPVLTCPGHGGYEVEMSFSATTTILTITGKDDFALTFNVLGHGPKIEWRFADGKPFAVILRENGEDEDGKKSATMRVRGLAGFEAITGDVNARAAGANGRARRIADDGYRGAN